MNKKVLVTGGSGFIGQHLIRNLISKKYQVLNVDLRTPENGDLSPFIRADIRDDLNNIFEEFKPDCVINLAAETSVRPKRLDHFTTNIDGVNNLIFYVNKFEVQKTLFYSTQYVYQGYENWEGYDRYHPFTTYGHSKKIGEELVINNCRRPYLILRPTNIWGPDNEIYVKGLFKIMSKGLYFHPTIRNVERAYGYVENICTQTIKLLESNQVNRIYYLGDKPVNLFELVSKFQRKINGSEVKTLSVVIFKFASVMGDLINSIGLPFPMNSTRLTNMISSNPVPMEDTFSITGEGPISLDDAIERTIEWYMNRTD